MDIKLEKKPWYIRYCYYLAGGILFLAFIIYVIILSAGPSKLRIDQENVQIAEVKNDKFMEYVDVEGLIQPILTIIVNARESGSVDRIVGEGIGQGIPAFPGIRAEEDPSGDHGEHISAQHSGDISLQQSEFRIGEESGQSQSTESQNVINDQLHGIQYIGINEKL